MPPELNSPYPLAFGGLLALLGLLLLLASLRTWYRLDSSPPESLLTPMLAIELLPSPLQHTYLRSVLLDLALQQVSPPLEVQTLVAHFTRRCRQRLLLHHTPPLDPRDMEQALDRAFALLEDDPSDTQRWQEALSSD